MAMGTERSKALHNFTLPYLKWGNQRHLKCTKLTPDSSPSSAASAVAGESAGDRRSHSAMPIRRRLFFDSETTHESPRDSSSKKIWIPDDSRIDDGGGGDGVNGIEAVREKIIIDLKTEAAKMKDAILGKGVRDDDENDEENDLPSSSTAATTAEEDVPWKLRTRRATSNGNNNNNNNNHNDNGKNQLVGRNEIVNALKSPAKSKVSPEKPRMSKIIVPLSKSEIEEDYVAFFGHRPRRRPIHKRTRNVQRVLDTIFPGLGLTEVSLDLYRVYDPNENGKR